MLTGSKIICLICVLEGNTTHGRSAGGERCQQGPTSNFCPGAPNWVNPAMCPDAAPASLEDRVTRADIPYAHCEKNRFHLRLCIRADAEEFAEGHTQALMEVMVDPATSFDPLCITLQQVQNQWPQVSGNQQSIILLQQQLSHTLQNTLPVLLTPYLRRDHMGKVHVWNID